MVWTARMLTALEIGAKDGATIERLLCRAWAVLPCRSLCSGPSVLSEVTRRLESRVRETRTHGSEGRGARNPTGSSYPYHSGLEAPRKGS